MICRNQSDRGPLEEKEEKEEKCGPLLTGRLDGARQKKKANNVPDLIRKARSFVNYETLIIRLLQSRLGLD